MQLSTKDRHILEDLAAGKKPDDIVAERHDITLKDIAQAAHNALRLDTLHRHTSTHKSGDTDTRTYEVWTPSEDKRLQSMLEHGTPIQTISNVLERHPMVIRRRMRQLELDSYL